jgi:hypothetical protein
MALLCIASCTTSPSGPTASTAPESAGRTSHVTPANIRRLRPELPAGYEVTESVRARSPAGYWGIGEAWSADPSQCASLANPVSGDAAPQGMAASGPGGIVYAAVVESTPPPMLDAGVVAGCSRWTMTAGASTATVDLVAAPLIEDAPTLAMTTTSRTVVEGGTETDSHIESATAYLDRFVVYAVVVTDPGAPHPPLPSDFAETLLVKAVAALRG